MATDRLINSTQGDSIITALQALEAKGWTSAQITSALTAMGNTNTALAAISAAISALDFIPAATSFPIMDGTAAVGVSAKYAREDHVHPTDAKITAMQSLLNSASLYNTATGNPAVISGALAVPVRGLTVTMIPVQAGSGDPSPSNVRAISGRDSVTVTRTNGSGGNSATVTVSLVDASGNTMTVYGGTLDVTAGILTVTWAKVAGSAVTWTKNTANNYFRGTLAPKCLSGGVSGRQDAVSSQYKVTTAQNVSSHASGNACFAVGARYLGDTNISVYDANCANMTESEFQTYIQNVEFCYPLAVPVLYALPAAQVSVLAGANRISADAGDVTVEYQVNSNLGG